jgi:hypothetical protein
LTSLRQHHLQYTLNNKRKHCCPELIEFITEDLLVVIYKLQFLIKTK